MLKKKLSKIICSSMALTFVVSAPIITTANTVNNSNSTVATEINKSGNCSYVNGGPMDASLADEEKIIEMLKKEGKLSENATLEEAHAAFIAFMETFKEQNDEPLTKLQKDLKARAKETLANDDISTYGLEDETNKVTNINVLAVMVEYNDVKHNSITPDESDMYYENYDKQHYQDMLFGDNGYTGPNGENLISLKQFYNEQSGGTLNINGTVTDWYSVSKNAAYYGESSGGSNDLRPREIVMETLNNLANDPTIDLSEFDKIDRYDLDGDGDYNEPDGMIDYLIVIHAGVGEEAGGGAQGSDAIWSHRWNLGGLYPIEGTEYTDENGNTRPYYAYDYTIEPEDGAAGVLCHEFGHDLGAPDEYDTIYSSASSEPVAFWSLMSSGSWGGAIPGTEPTGISPYSRQLFQNIYGGRWQNQTVIDYSALSKRGTKYTINSAAETGDVLRINLPDVEYKINTPTSGEYSYWGGKGSDGTPIQNSMTATVDLTTTTNPVLNFKTWYDIEEGWDFGTVQIRETGSEDWTVLPGNITTTDHNPSADILVGHGITGTSDGWVDGIFDLTAYAGKSIELKFEYETDSYTFGQGFYIDDITITDNDSVIFSDDAEILDKFTLDGFTQDKGVEYATNYYLVEWRNHSGVDTSLAHVNRLGTLISYDPGMVVWYVNEFYNDNHGANHPGGGYLSVIDADQKNSYWIFEDKTAAFTTNSYQMHDAAFSMKLGSKFVVDATETYGRKAIDNHRSIHRTFKDTNDYTNSEIPTLGTILPKLGLNIEIVKQNLNNSGATVKISVK